MITQNSFFVFNKLFNLVSQFQTNAQSTSSVMMLLSLIVKMLSKFNIFLKTDNKS